MAESASAGIGDLPELFAKQRADLKLLDNSKRGLEEELNKYLARDLYHATPLRRMAGGSSCTSSPTSRLKAQGIGPLSSPTRKRSS
jgi:hypothetical protein